MVNRLYGAGRAFVVDREDRRRWFPTGQHRGHGSSAACDRVVARAQQPRLDEQSMAIAGFQIPGERLAVKRSVKRPIQKGDPPVTKSGEVVDGADDAAAIVVVD